MGDGEEGRIRSSRCVWGMERCGEEKLKRKEGRRDSVGWRREKSFSNAAGEQMNY